MPGKRPPARVDLEHLRSWRAYRGLSMDGLAALADLTRTAIANLESGNAKANPVTVFKLARALRITRKQLIEEEPPEETQESEGKPKERRAVA